MQVSRKLPGDTFTCHCAAHFILCFVVGSLLRDGVSTPTSLSLSLCQCPFTALNLLFCLLLIWMQLHTGCVCRQRYSAFKLDFFYWCLDIQQYNSLWPPEEIPRQSLHKPSHTRMCLCVRSGFVYENSSVYVMALLKIDGFRTCLIKVKLMRWVQNKLSLFIKEKNCVFDALQCIAELTCCLTIWYKLSSWNLCSCVTNDILYTVCLNYALCTQPDCVWIYHIL